MKKIDLKSYAKINLTLDVKGILPGGYHQVEMVMQQILLGDDISISWKEDLDASENKPLEINLKTNKPYLPTDERNLAYKAALLMEETYGPERGSLRIDIKKRIPVAAGLAGGSSNGAAVLHGLNVLWDLKLSLEELCNIGSRLGSDVPFCVMGQAAANRNLKDIFKGDPLACHCAFATGRGTQLEPLLGLESHLVLSKPAISVSTAAVYKGIDGVEIGERPNTAEMVEALKEKNREKIQKNLVNVLENFTLQEYSTVVYTKNKMVQLCKPHSVLMSGSGPTIFGLCDSKEEAQSICDKMKRYNKESFWTRTTC